VTKCRARPGKERGRAIAGRVCFPNPPGIPVRCCRHDGDARRKSLPVGTEQRAAAGLGQCSISSVSDSGCNATILAVVCGLVWPRGRSPGSVAGRSGMGCGSCLWRGSTRVGKCAVEHRDRQRGFRLVGAGSDTRGFWLSSGLAEPPLWTRWVRQLRATLRDAQPAECDRRA
jgi:hypothetical protein